MFILIGLYYVHGLDFTPFEHAVNEIILEIAQIFFFLYVAMTYIESTDRARCVSRPANQTDRAWIQLSAVVWITGLPGVFISPVADNLTTALILSTVC